VQEVGEHTLDGFAGMPRSLEVPSVRSKLEALGVEAMPMSPTEMDAFVQKQIAANAVLVKAADIKAH
jgi:tripartite-type tricarboxylate transporter receptor subunit TctC